MDWAHLTEQDIELCCPVRICSKSGSVRAGESYGQFSKQPSGRVDGLGSGEENRMEVEMKIRGLMMDPVTNMPIVVLKDVGSDSVLPIWVGVYEANAIALEIEKVTTPRPMTHDLIKNVLVGLDTRVHKVVVSELRDDTFYAVIWMEREDRKSTRLNSSHLGISYAVFCLKKKRKNTSERA